jgi:hypothetical protein
MMALRATEVPIRSFTDEVAGDRVILAVSGAKDRVILGPRHRSGHSSDTAIVRHEEVSSIYIPRNYLPVCIRGARETTWRLPHRATPNGALSKGRGEAGQQLEGTTLRPATLEAWTVFRLPTPPNSRRRPLVNPPEPRNPGRMTPRNQRLSVGHRTYVL